MHMLKNVIVNFTVYIMNQSIRNFKNIIQYGRLKLRLPREQFRKLSLNIFPYILYNFLMIIKHVSSELGVFQVLQCLYAIDIKFWKQAYYTYYADDWQTIGPPSSSSFRKASQKNL